jgi:uroporphyrinogen-III synthase
MEAGFSDVQIGPADGEAAVAMIRPGQQLLHLCGREHLPLDHEGGIKRRVVYASEAVATLPPTAHSALARGALALVHSPRSGAQFGQLVDKAGMARAMIAVAAISEAAAASAGTGWRRLAAADRPRDEALLELAAELCKKAREAE